MAKTKKIQPADLESLIDHQEQGLLVLQSYVRDYLAAEHKPKDTKKVILLVAKADHELSGLLNGLLQSKKASQAFAEQAAVMCSQVRELKRLYIGDMKSDLFNDLAEQHRNKKDFVKNATFFFGIPISFFMVVKNGMFQGIIKPEQAAGVGFLVSSGILAIEKIKKAFAATKILARQAPRQVREEVRDNFVLFYARTRLKELVLKPRQ